MLVGLAAAWACSDGSSSKAAPPPSTDRSTAGTAPFCQLARSYNEGFEQAGRTVRDPAQLRDVLGRAVDAIRQAEAVAPSEVKADVTLVGRTYGEFLTALERVDFAITQVPREDVQKVQAREFRSANERLQVYVRDVCGSTP